MRFYLRKETLPKMILEEFSSKNSLVLLAPKQEKADVFKSIIIFQNKWSNIDIRFKT